MKRQTLAIAALAAVLLLTQAVWGQGPPRPGRDQDQRRSSRREGQAPRNVGIAVGDADLQKPPRPKDDGEKRILDALDAARQGQRYANVSTADGRLLRQLTEAVGAKRVVELGTSTGESGLWFALALRKTGGHLYTHDIDPERMEVARENFRKAGVEDLIPIIEGDAHETVTQHKEPVKGVFIVAYKPGEPDYFVKL